MGPMPVSNSYINISMKGTRLPTLFVSHGGGPWPYVEEMKKLFAKTAMEFNKIPETLPFKPKAILVVSGHWEEPEFTVATSEHPPMVYDYSGFPEHTYHIKYAAPGSPPLARRIRALLGKSGIDSREDPARGFDHGTFVPLFLMYPEADIPVVTLSMKSNYDPLEHINLGKALFPLREEGVLIIGSGLSYHNMRGFGSRDAKPTSAQFEGWLNESISEPDARVRRERLLNWEKAPAARLAHPREDHLMPLMVVAGAAGDDMGHRIFTDSVWNTVMASYRFG
jgi:aromatic ring-opening dioxygenase catalytic subunit (LigB family)